MTFVLLLDQKAPGKRDVQEWLNKNGLVSWLANDVPHALEELSDFTVRNRPDVVLLEVALLPNSFENIESTFNMLSEDRHIAVLGLTDREKAGNRNLAKN